MDEISAAKKLKEELSLTKRESSNSYVTTQRKSELDDSGDLVKESPRNSVKSARNPIKLNGYLSLLSKASSFWKKRFNGPNFKKEK